MRNLPAALCLSVVLGGWFPACSQAPPEASPAASAESPAEPAALAVVDGKAITEEDLGIRGELLQLEQQRYEITNRALQNAIAERLLEAEAARRGVSLEALIEQEIQGKAGDPTDQEVEAFYEQQKQRIRRPLAEVRPQVAEALKSIKAGAIQDEFVAALREKSDVQVRLEPLRVPIELSQAPMRGPAEAPVTIVEFSDFQCPFCKRAQPIIQQVRERYPEQVNWRFKDLPLNSIHPAAQAAAEAARCAGDQGKFWEYRDALFHADQIVEGMHQGVSESLGLDSEPFLECLKSQKYRDAVQADSQEAQKLGISGTPTFVINGIVLSGAQPFEEFARVIEDELRRKGAASTANP
ncbi:MAG: thioredoxin domain-containing protein [Bryobacterales bacterium]